MALRGRTAPSRVVFGPHETNLGRGRAISDRHVAYYARRAAGGAGIVVTEIASVYDSDHPYERAPLARGCGAGWAEVAAGCRPHGTLVVAGLGHAGTQGSTAYGPTVLWGPSRIADVVSREVPMEMEQPEIDALVAGFGAAAALAVGAGLDGVEINAGQHSLVRQFRSGLTNHRVDGYGHDRERLLREVLVAVRAAVGEDRIVGLRLCVDELAPWAGITPSQVTVPAVDYVVPVRGSGMSVHATRPDLHTEPGFNRELCAGVRGRLAAWSAPRPVSASGVRVGGGDHGPLVVLQGSVVDPAMAQVALDEGTADLVEMTRAQIAQPDLVELVRAGVPERIRPSTLSNQRTAVRDVRNPIVSDDAEPGAGHELDDPAVEGTDPVPRDVLVVGGGPAGLEAARVLALRGHRVRLTERDAALGGALRLAAALPGRGRFGLLVDWWERELQRLGVQVRTGVEITAADLDGADLDGADLHGADLHGAVLLATGSVAASPPFPSDGPVLDAASFVRADLAELPPGPVLVHDPIGDWTGVGIAELLAAAGRPTVLVTPDPVAGTQLSRTGDLAPANGRLERAGVTRVLLSVLRSVAGGTAVVEHVWTGERREVGCALVVDCGARLPEESLGRPDLPRAGDCVAPRTVYEAVLEGRRAALAIGAGGMSGRPRSGPM